MSLVMHQAGWCLGSGDRSSRTWQGAIHNYIGLFLSGSEPHPWQGVYPNLQHFQTTHQWT